jgi:hypothetical protein
VPWSKQGTERPAIHITMGIHSHHVHINPYENALMTILQDGLIYFIQLSTMAQFFG